MEIFLAVYSTLITIVVVFTVLAARASTKRLTLLMAAWESLFDYYVGIDEDMKSIAQRERVLVYAHEDAAIVSRVARDIVDTMERATLVIGE